MGEVIPFQKKRRPVTALPRRRVNLFETAGLAIGKELDDYFNAPKGARRKETRRLERASQKQTMQSEVTHHATTQKETTNSTTRHE